MDNSSILGYGPACDFLALFVYIAVMTISLCISVETMKDR